VTRLSDTPVEDTNRPAADERSVQALLDAFGRALTAGDGRAITELWATPSFVLGDTMARTIEMREEIEEFFGSAKDQYAAMGITDTRAEITRLEWLTDRIALVDVRWPYLDAQGEEHGEERSTYTVRRGDDGELRICVAILRGVSEPD
jgi:hypothetical protein